MAAFFSDGAAAKSFSSRVSQVSAGANVLAVVQLAACARSRGAATAEDQHG